MDITLGVIEVGKLPWMALVFAATYWKTAVAAVWGLGFTYILAKRMKAWFKDDARDAAVGMKDEGHIFVNMKAIAKQRRPERTKEILTKGLFWLPLMAFSGGRKVAKVIFYPVLAYLDRAQTEGLAEGQRKINGAPALKGVPRFERSPEVQKTPDGILVEGENATKCMGCGMLAGYMDEHICTKPVVIENRRPAELEVRRTSTVECSDCGDSVYKDMPHKCSARVGPDGNGMIHCECGTSYKQDADFDHMCPEEMAGIEKPQCSDCERVYDPTTEVHAATSCRGCKEVHCKRYDCGARV